jgi:hypothetical protein
MRGATSLKIFDITFDSFSWHPEDMTEYKRSDLLAFFYSVLSDTYVLTTTAAAICTVCMDTVFTQQPNSSLLQCTGHSPAYAVFFTVHSLRSMSCRRAGNLHHYPLHSRCHRRPLNSPPTQATTNVKTISGATSESLYVKNAITTTPNNSVYYFFYCMLHHIHSTLWPIVNCYRRMCPYQYVDIVAWKWSGGAFFEIAQKFV